MCDIWKDNKNLKQLTENDIAGLLSSLKKLGTRQVVMSGGEALLNQNFFSLCRILKQHGISICLLSTGLLLKRYANSIVEWVDEVIVSLDGDEPLHDAIRNMSGAYSKLKEGVLSVRTINPGYKITGRSVIHKLNFHAWPQIIHSAKELELNQISFLPADVSSEAFNRTMPWEAPRQAEVMLSMTDLPILQSIIHHLIETFDHEFNSGFIAESRDKIRQIYTYYSALHGLSNFPRKKCNAPWVSAVVEADGNVRPCFFLPAFDNIRNRPLDEILNSASAISFRQELDMDKNPQCKSCVCSLQLNPRTNPVNL
jgi:MoaA/NifB/PqqE/SkfB family radical SAM enzyme